MHPRIYFIFLTLVFFQPRGFSQAQAGKYEIQLEIKPIQNQYVYLASYYGSIKTMMDSAFLNKDSKGKFTASNPLPQGVYILASPHRTILGELIIGADQEFSIRADTAKPESGLAFSGSTDNDLFSKYTVFVNGHAIKAEQLRRQMAGAGETEQATLNSEIRSLNQEILDYRKGIEAEHPESLLALLFRTMHDIRYPASLQNPKTREDTMAMYRFGKDHYWDGVDFMDGRLVRTPVFDARMKDYLQNWVSPEPDSILHEFNWMMGYGRNDPEMERYLISYFVDNYINPRIMGQDKVFLHVYNNFIAAEPTRAPWLNENQLKIIRERAYRIMGNQLGAPAWDMDFPDPNNVKKRLYNTKGEYTVVVFWDIDCGHCKEVLPKLDSLYKQDWKKENIAVYAVMTNESNLKDWVPYIKEVGNDWTHVHEPDEIRHANERAGKPNFRQLYDIRSTPTLFLLDKEKRILAKDIAFNDLAMFLKRKLDEK